MTNLANLPEDVLKEITIDSQGVSRVSFSGAERLLGISNVNIGKHFRASTLRPTKLAEILMSAGFDASTLELFSKEGIPDTAFAIVCEYYAFYGQKKTQQAQDLYRSYAAIGFRVWAQRMKGWNDDDRTQEQIAELKRMNQILSDKLSRAMTRLAQLKAVQQIQQTIDPVVLASQILEFKESINPGKYNAMTARNNCTDLLSYLNDDGTFDIKLPPDVVDRLFQSLKRIYKSSDDDYSQSVRDAWQVWNHQVQEAENQAKRTK